MCNNEQQLTIIDLGGDKYILPAISPILVWIIFLSLYATQESRNTFVSVNVLENGWKLNSCPTLLLGGE